MRTRIVRLGIGIVVAALLAGPVLVSAKGPGQPPDGFGQCMSSCARGLSFLGDIGGKVCNMFCRNPFGNGG